MSMRVVIRTVAAISLAVVGCVATPAAAEAWGFPAAPSSACGYSIINSKMYRCTFDDEFGASKLDTSKWVVNTGFVSGTAAAYACTVNDPRYISVSNGALHLTTSKVSTPVACNNAAASYYEAPTISTWRLFSQQYGRFEVRMRTTATTAAGLHEAFWLWPDDRYTTVSWPKTGEIDVAETYSNYSNLSVPYLHYTANDNGGPTPGTNTSWNCTAQRGVWNTYTLDWTPTSLTISVNGTTCLVNTSADPAFNQRYIMMLSQALGSGTNAYTGLAPLPATLDVDYVRVYQPL